MEGWANRGVVRGYQWVVRLMRGVFLPWCVCCGFSLKEAHQCLKNQSISWLALIS